jgi:hypothetical protein
MNRVVLRAAKRVSACLYAKSQIESQRYFRTSRAGAVMKDIKAGKLRALGVTTLTRLELLPDVPAIAQSVPGGEVEWSGRISRCGDEMMQVMLYEAAPEISRTRNPFLTFINLHA